MPNRLAHEKSPYLLQHSDNAVDWYPWGPEALRFAQQEDRPIILSIGYSACHWCHVMAHESFENPDTASLMNERFVNIKVDREERPDLDAVYMEAVQALSGQGGWPLNVFLTPGGLPFFGGTYFPPEPRYGLPSWTQVVQSMSDAYRQERAGVLRNAKVLTEYVRKAQELAPSREELDPRLLENAYQALSSQFDWTDGGFGSAPKFPQPMSLQFVLRMWRRLDLSEAGKFVELTLNAMADGGIFDHLGGGFHRYSVDANWVVPHFEKMLYDNALLATTYVQAFQAMHQPRYQVVAEKTLDYLISDMQAPSGAFYSSQDADSEGVEGKFYVWTPQEVESVLDAEEARLALLRFGISSEGNFEGDCILTVAMSVSQIAERTGIATNAVERALGSARDKLLQARSERPLPGRDTKILASWNALAISAFATAGRVFDRKDYLETAIAAADFLLNQMRPGGHLVRSFQDGPGNVPAFLEDYAFLIEALVTLSETAFHQSYLAEAQSLAATMVEHFWDDARGAFFDSPSGLEEPVARPRSFFDNPIPSGNSAATFSLLRLRALAGEDSFGKWALPGMRTARSLFIAGPGAAPYMLCALDFYLSPQTQIAILGDPLAGDTRCLIQTVYSRYLPNKVVSVGLDDSAPLLRGRSQVQTRPTAFVCHDFTCNLPITDPVVLEQEIAAL